ncbi:MAG: kynureninase [Acidobacteriota bacterium]|nr:kynureninase [Acidobacteriota bacterium]
MPTHLKPLEFEPSASFASKIDAQDLLKNFREKFYIPKQANGEDVIYLTGNSLGLQPKTTRNYIEQELKDWETLGVEGHLHAKNPWLPYHEFLTEQMANIVGAKPIETVVMNSLTVNLHLLMVSFYRPTKERYKIVIEAGAFPSDQYAVESQIKFHRFDIKDSLLELKPRENETTLRTEDIEKTIAENGDSIALILLGGVNYYTGQAFDMKRITEAGHKAGAVVGFDLAHAAGNIELSLHDWNIDYAAWCSYKYLNAGPGGVAGCFVHERHSENFDLPRFAGWWGHDKETRFLMNSEFVPIKGAEGWQLSNPPIFQMAALKASLDIFEEAGMKRLTEKSRRLTGYLEFLLGDIHDERISVITPSDANERGCQLSIRVKTERRHLDGICQQDAGVPSNKNLFKQISERGVIADWREPDVIRVAPVPLYNSFADVFRFAEILKDCLA